jgi:SAM-dependent methyltransferase
MYEVLARYYDQIHEQLTADLPIILELARENGGPVLDLGCGTGRLLFPLAEAGYKVTGVDNSPQMLAIANKRLSVESEEVREFITLWEKDICSLAPGQTATGFSLALLSYNTLMHFREREIEGLLEGVSGILRPGGQLFIDMENPFQLAEGIYSKKPVLEASFIDESTNLQVEQWSRSWIDTKAQTLTVSWQFRTQDKESENQKLQMIYHYFYPHQILMLLQQAGLRMEKLIGSYQGEPFQEDSERLVLLASLPE